MQRHNNAPEASTVISDFSIEIKSKFPLCSREVWRQPQTSLGGACMREEVHVMTDYIKRPKFCLLVSLVKSFHLIIASQLPGIIIPSEVYVSHYDRCKTDQNHLRCMCVYDVIPTGVVHHSPFGAPACRGGVGFGIRAYSWENNLMRLLLKVALSVWPHCFLSRRRKRYVLSYRVQAVGWYCCNVPISKSVHALFCNKMFCQHLYMNVNVWWLYLHFNRCAEILSPVFIFISGHMRIDKMHLSFSKQTKL